MLKKEVEQALNEQLNAELYSSYLYLSMASYFESINMAGFANWMKVQAQEELGHGMKFYDYIVERGGRVMLKPIEGPQTEWKSAFSAFEHVYKHEQKVTGLIDGLVELSIKEKDHATNSFLQWFVDEQVEEESSADAIVQRLKRAADSPGGLFMLDNELGKRVAAPAQSSGEKQ
jgi:ferritin